MQQMRKYVAIVLQEVQSNRFQGLSPWLMLENTEGSKAEVLKPKPWAVSKAPVMTRYLGLGSLAARLHSLGRACNIIT